MPKPNIRGRDIKVVDPGVPSESEPAPTILPRYPLNLVIDDCEGLPWFNGSETVFDAERGLLVEGWTDPGLDYTNRTLTILVRSRSCWNHPFVQRYKSEFAEPSPEEHISRANVRGRDVRVISRGGDWDEDAVDDTTREVLPRSPLQLVVDDCTEFDWFTTDDTSSDPDNGLLTIHFWDPGVQDNRSLSIYVRSPSCWNHPGVKTYREYFV